MEILPDFLIKPREVLEDKDLQPLDGDVYGVVYWCTKMKMERCLFKDKKIASLLHCSVGGVKNAVARLKKKGYISSLYDRQTHQRELIANIFFGKAGHQTMTGRSSNDDVAGHQMMTDDSHDLATANNNNGNKINNTVNGVVKGGNDADQAKEAIREKVATPIASMPSLDIDEEHVKYVTADILKQLGDKTSEAFYWLIASRIPETVIRTALSEVKEGNVENPAALFTYKMQSYATSHLHKMSDGLSNQRHSP